MTSSLSSSVPCSSCVLGIIPDLLRLAMAEGTHGGITAYMTSELPLDPECSKGDDPGRAGTLADSPGLTGTYAVFEDARNCCRWTVELVMVEEVGDGEAKGTWWASPEQLATMGVTAGAEVVWSAPSQLEESAGSRRLSRIAAMRYYMKPDTWRHTPLSREREAAAANCVAGEVPHCGSASAAEATSTNPMGGDNNAQTHRQATPSMFSATSSVATAAATREASALSAVSSPLRGLPLRHFVEKHLALVRRLVRVLAPQRQTIPSIVREVCTTRVKSPSSGITRRVCEIPSADALEAQPVQYTERDVAAVAEQLTSSHPRQPRLRELKSEGYLFMNLDEFADGETRNKAVNRAYPALALHWPASAQQMDVMERYVDRDVVLETRKRHPQLSEDGSHNTQQRKRNRSSSSTASCASGEDDDEELKATAPSSASAPLSQRLPGATAAVSRCLFHTLHEYPQSLEHGDLHTWARGPEVQQARDSLKASRTWTQGTASSVSKSADAATLTSLPVTNEKEVEMLRNNYDAVAVSEGVLEKHLRAYSDTVQELRNWYREELCTQQFRCELEAWLRIQEESRATLTDLYIQVHSVRYRLQRDLSDYLHLHALGVL
ncbi:hypothetical protein JKF63_01698 [Porcisia hertigi]|uniref:Uncharacterized protein n=1 Tax=Porcisia hertigi TaxID=2761500 RepID=A0A836L0B9_9TRYP|nr:hypothetical protein JKF63_01698 [Porcisia hertigi]